MAVRAPRRAIVSFGVILGTGVGGGLAVDGRAWDGPNGVAGEWGTNLLPWPNENERPGPPCYCGKTGDRDVPVGPRARARPRARDRRARASAVEIADRAAEGDARAEETLARYEDRLARGLAHVIDILDPEAIVLAGLVAHRAPLRAGAGPAAPLRVLRTP